MMSASPICLARGHHDPAERVACIRIEGLEDDAEGGLSFAHVRGRFNASRAASTDA